MWDIGNLSHTGGPSVSIAGLRVEDRPFWSPAAESLSASFPSPPLWKHAETGQRINMHEDRAIAGTAVVLEVHLPAAAIPRR